jgi:transposase
VISDLMGVSGRNMIEALIAGQRDPAKLARLADPRVKASQETLRQALRGRVTRQHRFLLRLHLDQIDGLDAAIAKIDREVKAAIAPFRTAVERVSSVPGIKNLAALQIISEIGTDMSRFPNDANLVSWACICPRSDGARASGPPRAFARAREERTPLRRVTLMHSLRHQVAAT